MGIFVILLIYLVLGFMLAWVGGLVTREDVEVKTGVLTLVVAGIVGAIIGAILDETMGENTPATLIGVVARLAVLTVCLKAIAKFTWKQSAIVAVIYTIVITGLLMALGSCA